MTGRGLKGVWVGWGEGLRAIVFPLHLKDEGMQHVCICVRYGGGVDVIPLFYEQCQGSI